MTESEHRGDFLPGRVQIYTGDGKGKTSAAIGQAVRAAGHGLNSRIIQFMKGGTASGETVLLKSLPQVRIDRIGGNFIGPERASREEVAASLVEGLREAGRALDGPYDIVILDEIVTAVRMGVVEESQVIDLINRPGRTAELILTGRGASPALIEAADLVTEMVNIKHPHDEGVGARAGIEY